MRFKLAVVFTLAFLFWGVARTVNEINFDRNCSGYLKRAADANIVELAIKNLEVAVKYAEANGLTSGYTSVLYRTPDEDLGFWYSNLMASLQELRAVKPDATQLERTNVLMKLRETLLDTGQSISVTTPGGSSVFPNNSGYAFWGWFSSIGAIICWIAFIAEHS